MANSLPTYSRQYEPNDSPAVVPEGATFLRWIAPAFGFVGLRAYSGGFRGAGKTLTAAAIAVVLFGFLRLPIAYVASQGVVPLDIRMFRSPTPSGIRFAFVVSGVIATVTAAGWFELGNWRGAGLIGASADASESGTDERDRDDGSASAMGRTGADSGTAAVEE